MFRLFGNEINIGLAQTFSYNATPLHSIASVYILC